MKTIYNEKKYAERALIKKEIDKRNGLTLAILCKYYYFEKNKNIKQIIGLLTKFLDEADGIYDRDLLPELIEKYTKNQMKPINIESIKITLDEIATILTRESEEEQRLMFAILVAYKFKNENCRVSDEFRCHSGNNIIKSPFGEHFKDAKVKSTKENKLNLLGGLENDGLILLDIENMKTIELTYVNEDSPTAFEVKWQNDVWVDFEIYKGNKQYKRCECCGNVIKLTKNKKGGTPSKYCSDDCKKYIDNKKRNDRKR